MIPSYATVTGREAYHESGYGDDTFVMLKPDALERGVVDETLSYIQQHNVETTAYRGHPLRIRAMTMMRPDAGLIDDHYGNVDPAIREELHEYFGTADESVGDEIVTMIVSGTDAVARMRDLVVDPIDPDEDTFLPQNSEPGTIRGDIVQEGTGLYADPDEWPNYYMNRALEADEPLYNLIHASDGSETAREEIERFFGADLLEQYEVADR
jgi:nucleoside diphosphate kinase